ncbi:MAG: L-lactate dehydrogenase [Oscillospiraceae bacterium]|jgi:L-lactate dehydrogenase|nr:L-lactate dehydrogenase [Oscillospiraceae bacterium]MCI9581954.1 L-lactate dehydrogenase [Oscillospiraceae bacterium]
MSVNYRKAAVIGCGFVGASIAFRFLQQGLFSHLVLVDANREKAEGEAMDLSDGLPYGASMEITAGTYNDVAGCGLVVVTAGVNQKPGETRLELIGRNAAILKSILHEITSRKFEGILLIVSNPVDVLTYLSKELSGYPRERVIGSGTVLDTARLKQLLGEELGVDSRNVHAFIVGEHGDSELAVWSGANVSGLDLQDFCRLRGKALNPQDMDRLYREVQGSADAIIRRKGATYYGIAMAVGRIAECIVKDEHAVLPVSAVLEGEYGLEKLALSVPAIVGKNGLEKILEIPLSQTERTALDSSAQQMQQAIRQVSSDLAQA